eukprot:m51a1_g534 putative pre-mrna-splicing regulator wtap-like (288) ;mRNA; r:386060-387475
MESANNKRPAAQGAPEEPACKRQAVDSAGDLVALRAELDAWRAAFAPHATACTAADALAKARREAAEAKKGEAAATIRLTLKERELHEMAQQIEQLHAAAPSKHALPCDPAINYNYATMKEQLKEAERKLAQVQEYAEAVTFTPQSNVGCRLLARCRALLQENEELGKQLSEGNVQRLELRVAQQTRAIDWLRNNWKEAVATVAQLEGDVARANSKIAELEAELARRTGGQEEAPAPEDEPAPEQPEEDCQQQQQQQPPDDDDQQQMELATEEPEEHQQEQTAEETS